jgi:predicted SAM-dependent methyltransferase
MGLEDISTKRSLLSYAKVQRLISSVIRNKRIFFSKKSTTLPHLNLGCGMHPEQDMVNVDWHWCPGVDVVCDIRRPYPFPADRFEGIYCEHVIDGLPKAYFNPNLKEMHRVLKPGGTLRITFCDSELYVDAYVKRRQDPHYQMPFFADRGHRTGMEALDWIYHHWTHKTLVDFETLSLYLKEAGFREITRCTYRQGRNPALLRDQVSRAPESLYVEAVK